MPETPHSGATTTPEARREQLRRLLEARALEQRAAEREVPVSSQQARLWVAHHLDRDDPSQNLRTELRIEGRLDLDALEQSFARLLTRHEQLRATFHSVGGRPVARIAAAVEAPLKRLELPDTSGADREAPDRGSPGRGAQDREAEVERLVRRSAGLPFDLERGPLVRLAVLPLSHTETVAILTIHHIVCDAWSMDLLLGELLETYAAIAAGRKPEPAEAPMSYGQFSEQQAETLAGTTGSELEHFWRRRLEGFVGEPLLPWDRVRPPGTQMKSRRLPFSFPPHLREGIERLGRSHGATAYMTLLAALTSLLHRLSGAKDIVIATPVANRRDEAWEAIVGYFVNLLPMRIGLAEGVAFDRVLSDVRRQVLEAQDHQELPVHKIAESAGLRPTHLMRGLFQHVAAPKRRLDAGELAVSALPIDLGRTHHDLSLTTWLDSEGPGGVLEYSSDLFDAASAERLVADLESALGAIVDDPRIEVADLPVSADWPVPWERPVSSERAASGDGTGGAPAAPRPGPPARRTEQPPPDAPPNGTASGTERGEGSGEASGVSSTTLEALTAIWRSVLELEDVSPFDNFLDVGGDSLLAMQVIERAEAELGVRMAPADLFTQTLTQLAASLEARRG